MDHLFCQPRKILSVVVGTLSRGQGKAEINAGLRVPEGRGHGGPGLKVPAGLTSNWLLGRLSHTICPLRLSVICCGAGRETIRGRRTEDSRKFRSFDADERVLKSKPKSSGKLVGTFIKSNSNAHLVQRAGQIN